MAHRHCAPATFVLLALASVSAVPAARAACSAADMKGDFATQPAGAIVAGPLAGQFAATGVVHFDGEGRFTGVTTSSFSGNILYPFAATGTYTMTADCFLSVLETTLGLTFEGYLTASGNEVVLFQPDPGAITVNLLRRILLPAGCSNASLDGNWAFQAAGTNFTSGARFAQASRVRFDGKGNFSGTTGYSDEGDFNRRTIGGTVQVNADCTFIMRYFDQTGAATSLFGTFFSRGEQFLLIYSVNGTVITGSGRQAVN